MLKITTDDGDSTYINSVASYSKTGKDFQTKKGNQ